jgi:hypothetical protein
MISFQFYVSSITTFALVLDSFWFPTWAPVRFMVCLIRSSVETLVLGDFVGVRDRVVRVGVVVRLTLRGGLGSLAARVGSRGALFFIVASGCYTFSYVTTDFPSSLF